MGRVVVVGAGIAGLVTAKVMRDDGFDVIVFEKDVGIGGVWSESRTYPGLRTNNSRDTYAFSDHPYDRSADVFPTAPQVRSYLRSYVERFELASLIRPSTEVVGVVRAGDGFDVTVRTADGLEAVRCDFVVVCAGTFSEPNMPAIDGVEGFAGTVLHSSHATDPALFAGRRVIVVGAGKSALDCAAWATEHARTCTLVFRAPQWMAPRFLPGGLTGDRLMFRRVVEVLYRYHRLNRFERFLHGPASAVPRGCWRGLSRVFRLVLRMPAVMVPDSPLPLQIETIGVAQEFYALAHRGKLELRRDRVVSFDGERVLLASGEALGADLVILATGWHQSFGFLAPELRSAARADGRLTLYRHILPPTEPRLGFVGYTSSFACQHTSELSAHWLSQHFRGELPLPSVAVMNAEVGRVSAWQAEVFPRHPEGHFIGPYMAHYADDLLTDMGVPTRRMNNAFAEYLAPYTPRRYEDLAAQRRASRQRSLAC
jgi:dimethylaniline monooxygenase (N-oxide forming)